MGWHQRRTLCSHFKIGKGKAAFIGDSSLVEDRSPKYLREDNGKPKKRTMVLKNKIMESY